VGLNNLRCAHCGDAVEGARIIHLHRELREAYYFCSAEPDEMARGASCLQKWTRGAPFTAPQPSL
jgi:hypothetical protein